VGHKVPRKEGRQARTDGSHDEGGFDHALRDQVPVYAVVDAVQQQRWRHDTQIPVCRAQEKGAVSHKVCLKDETTGEP